MLKRRNKGHDSHLSSRAFQVPREKSSACFWPHLVNGDSMCLKAGFFFFFFNLEKQAARSAQVLCFLALAYDLLGNLDSLFSEQLPLPRAVTQMRVGRGCLSYPQIEIRACLSFGRLAVQNLNQGKDNETGVVEGRTSWMTCPKEGDGL